MVNELGTFQNGSRTRSAIRGCSRTGTQFCLRAMSGRSDPPTSPERAIGRFRPARNFAARAASVKIVKGTRASSGLGDGPSAAGAGRRRPARSGRNPRSRRSRRRPGRRARGGPLARTSARPRRGHRHRCGRARGSCPRARGRRSGRRAAAHEAPVEREGDLLLRGHDAVAALVLDLLGQVVGQPRGRRVGLERVGEDAQPLEPRRPDEGEQLLELRLGLAGEADDERRPQRPGSGSPPAAWRGSPRSRRGCAAGASASACGR